MKIRLGAAAAVALTSVAVAGVATAPAMASGAGGQTTQHDSFDPTGAVFTCNNGDITVTGGAVDQVMHFGQDAAGVFHYTGTITLNHVTATDAAGNLYTITGALWFGGKGTQDQQYVATDTNHFVIHDATGGVYGKVRVVDHYTINGSSFTFDMGGCEAPQN